MLSGFWPFSSCLNFIFYSVDTLKMLWTELWAESVALPGVGSLAGLEGEHLPGGARYFRQFKEKTGDIQDQNKFLKITSVNI